MPWVLMTPLGTPVEPEVKRNFAIASAPEAPTALSTAGPMGVRARSSNSVAPRFAPSRLATISALWPIAASALANGAVSAT
jgi:hypothetical protein